MNFIKYKLADLNAVAITSISLLLIAPFAIVYLFVFTDFAIKLQSTTEALHAFLFIVLLGCMSTAIATIIFNHLVRISTPLFASSVTYIMPIVAVMWGLVDNEQLHLGHIAGMAIIIVGVYLVNRKR